MIIDLRDWNRIEFGPACRQFIVEGTNGSVLPLQKWPLVAKSDISLRRLFIHQRILTVPYSEVTAHNRVEILNHERHENARNRSDWS